MSIFFIDSNCELWYKSAEELGLKVIQMPYTIDGEEFFYDLGKNTDFKAFYKKIRNGSIPITSALNPYNYTEIFEPYLAAGEDILYFSFSHKMSATFESLEKSRAELKEKYPDRKITVVDSKNISIGAGLPIYFAAKKYASGASDEEVIECFEKISSHTFVYFLVDDLKHLKRGGRLTAAKAFFGTILNVKPMLTVSAEGKLENFHNSKGKKGAFSVFLSKMKEAEIDKDYPMYILDADDEEAGSFLADAVKEEFSMHNIVRQPVGPVIGTHCGPGTIGVVFIGKKKTSEVAD